MIKKTIPIVTYSIVSAVSSHASLALIIDDFSSGTVVADQRFQDDDIDTGNWIKRDTAVGDPPGSELPDPSWTITGGQLTNTATETSDDMGAFLMNSVDSTDASLTQITVSFDYSVGAGSALYFHSALYTGDLNIAPDPDSPNNLSRISRTGGLYHATGTQDFNSQFGAAHNLHDGITPDGTTTNAVAMFMGGSSGTFTRTFDVSGYTGINSVADISHVLAAFTLDTAEAGDGVVTIDNFNFVAVPEPSSVLLLGFGLAAVTFRRCRSSRA